MICRPQHLWIETNGVKLHVAATGPEDGPLVILLHGFPELWYAWRHYLEALAEAGFRVLAPDQRGYNKSDKPKGRMAYRLPVLARDVVGLIDHMGRERAAVVGHDWGAGVAWWVAIAHPERVSHLVSMEIPHPKIFRNALLTDPRQAKKSWYMFLFQVPWLAERMLLKDEGREFFKRLQESANPGVFTEEESRMYRESWREPGAMTGMLNWYRAMATSFRMPSHKIRAPTLLIWGKKDPVLGYEMGAPSLALCEDARLELFDDATHWVQHEEKEAVTRLLLQHLRR